MNKKLSIQAFSVRDVMTTPEEMAETFKKLASFGYDGIQTTSTFMGGPEFYAKAAADAGLRIIGTHVGINPMDDIEQTVRIHRILGTTNAGVGGMPGLNRTDLTRADVESFIDKANTAAAKLSKYGMKFTYHNHCGEFAKIGNDMIMDILAKELDPVNASFVLDTCWLQHGGVSILEWMEKLAGRVDILHLKDAKVPLGTNDFVITELGAGNLNFKDIVHMAEQIGVQDLCYEQDNNFRVNSLESAKESAEYFYRCLI